MEWIPISTDWIYEDDTAGSQFFVRARTPVFSSSLVETSLTVFSLDLISPLTSINQSQPRVHAPLDWWHGAMASARCSLRVASIFVTFVGSVDTVKSVPCQTHSLWSRVYDWTAAHGLQRSGFIRDVSNRQLRSCRWQPEDNSGEPWPGSPYQCAGNPPCPPWLPLQPHGLPRLRSLGTSRPFRDKPVLDLSAFLTGSSRRPELGLARTVSSSRYEASTTCTWRCLPCPGGGWLWMWRWSGNGAMLNNNWGVSRASAVHTGRDTLSRSSSSPWRSGTMVQVELRGGPGIFGIGQGCRFLGMLLYGPWDCGRTYTRHTLYRRRHCRGVGTGGAGGIPLNIRAGREG